MPTDRPVVTDSTNYLPAADLDRLGIDVVSLHVHDGDVMRPEVDIDLGAFYRRLADTRAIPTSSQPSPEALVRAFTDVIVAGDDALGLFMSGKMSGTVQAAHLAADLVRDAHREARISVIDTESNCMQEGFAVLSAAEAARSEGSLEDCERSALDTMARTRFLFTPHTLEYLHRGGRISGASALLGSMLQITPILTVEDGVTTVSAKVRTRKRALADIARRMRADVQRCGLRRAAVHAIVDLETATDFAREQIDPIAGAAVPVIPIGPVVGLHVGPALGVAYETLEPLR